MLLMPSTRRTVPDIVGKIIIVVDITILHGGGYVVDAVH